MSWRLTRAPVHLQHVGQSAQAEVSLLVVVLVVLTFLRRGPVLQPSLRSDHVAVTGKGHRHLLVILPNGIWYLGLELAMVP